MVFAVLFSSEEKPIIKVLPMKKNQLLRKIYIYIIAIVLIYDTINEPRQLSIRNVVVYS